MLERVRAAMKHTQYGLADYAKKGLAKQSMPKVEEPLVSRKEMPIENQPMR